MKKIFMKTLTTLLIIFSLVTVFQSVAYAAYSADVSTYWETITMNGGVGVGQYSYNVNNITKTIYYLNGYTYTQQKNDITKWSDLLVKGFISRVAYTRIYRTY